MRSLLKGKNAKNAICTPLFITILVILICSFYQTYRYISPQPEELTFYQNRSRTIDTYVFIEQMIICIEDDLISIQEWGTICINKLTEEEQKVAQVLSDEEENHQNKEEILIIPFDKVWDILIIPFDKVIENQITIINNETGESIVKSIENNTEDSDTMSFIFDFQNREYAFQRNLSFEISELSNDFLITIYPNFDPERSGNCIIYIKFPIDYEIEHIKSETPNIHLEELGNIKILSLDYRNIEEEEIEIRITKEKLDPSVFYGFVAILLTLLTSSFLIFWRSHNNEKNNLFNKNNKNSDHCYQFIFE